MYVCIVCYETRRLCRLFPTAVVLGFNLCGRGVVPRKCWNVFGPFPEPCWNPVGTMLEPSRKRAGTMLELFRNLAGTLPEPCWNSGWNLLEPSWQHVGKLLWRVVLVLIVSASTCLFSCFVSMLSCFAWCAGFFQVMGAEGAHLKMKIFF